MRRIITASLLMAVMLSGHVSAYELPDVAGEWHSVSENVVPLVGSCRAVYRTYTREAPKGTLEVILTEGAGTGSLYVPDSVNDAEGMMPTDAGFKLLTVSGHKAIVERQSFMPLVLAIDAGDNITLTIESSSLNENELSEFAEVILSSWNATESGSSPAQ